ncbi:MAG: exopolysaccharide production repressor protein [Pseudaminobacter sp.]
MSFLLFLRGLVGVLLVFAVTSYILTQSVWTAFVQTVICAILIQVGYFAAILFMVWRSGGQHRQGAEEPGKASDLPKTEEAPATKARQIPGVPRSRIP